jgi:hypothetical protein
MKKIVALALVFSFMTTMVFAEPVVLASRIIQTTDVISEADLNEPLFADVEASQLAAFEAEQVEGDGPVAAAAMSYFIGTYNVPQRIIAYTYNAQMAHGGFGHARAQVNAASFAAIVCVGAVVVAGALPIP